MVDKHAPLCLKNLLLRPHAPWSWWYTRAICDAKQLRHRAEQRWLEAKLTVHHQAYHKSCSHSNMINQRMLFEAKDSLRYYSTKVANCVKEVKALFNITRDLIGGGKMCNALPKASDISQLVNHPGLISPHSSSPTKSTRFNHTA